MFIVALKLSSDDDLLAYVSFSESMQKFINMKDAILRSLYDDDLNVVQAALSIEGLAAVANPDSLLKAYDGVLTKCIKIIKKGGYSSMSACFLAKLGEFFRPREEVCRIIYIAFYLFLSIYMRSIASV